MAKITITPTEAADKQARNLKNSIPDIRRGVEAVTESPMEKAARNPEKWLSGMQQSAGKWARNTAKVSLADWKGSMLGKGVNRIAEGIDNAHGKVVSFYDKLFPFEEALKTEIDKMPDTTIEDSVARASAWIRGMSKFES